MSRIVVGVDGSEGSLGALRWGLAEAERLGATVDAVTVYSPHTPSFAVVPEAMYIPPGSREEREKEAAETLDRAIDAVLGGREPPCQINRLVVSGRAASTLLDIAQEADMLVIGSRGLGGFTGLLLGSISHQCVSHAPCPVVVIPAG